jgi:hypothetical protein
MYVGVYVYISVCMYVCMCVCMYVGTPSLSPIEVGGSNKVVCVIYRGLVTYNGIGVCHIGVSNI